MLFQSVISNQEQNHPLQISPGWEDSPKLRAETLHFPTLHFLVSEEAGKCISSRRHLCFLKNVSNHSQIRIKCFFLLFIIKKWAKMIWTLLEYNICREHFRVEPLTCSQQALPDTGLTEATRREAAQVPLSWGIVLGSLSLPACSLRVLEPDSCCGLPQDSG